MLTFVHLSKSFRRKVRFSPKSCGTVAKLESPHLHNTYTGGTWHDHLGNYKVSWRLGTCRGLDSKLRLILANFSLLPCSGYRPDLSHAPMTLPIGRQLCMYVPRANCRGWGSFSVQIDFGLDEGVLWWVIIAASEKKCRGGQLCHISLKSWKTASFKVISMRFEDPLMFFLCFSFSLWEPSTKN